MKAKETLANTATAAQAAPSVNTTESIAKKFWLPIIFGASLFYLSHPAEAQEQQGTGSQTLQSAATQTQSPGGGAPATQKQGAGRGTKPHPEYSGTQSNQGSVQRYRNLVSGDEPGTRQGTTPGSHPPRDTTFDTAKMNSGSAPNTENINKDTVGPGGDNMMRDAIPGGSGLNR
jgi:hypothetical protein